MSAPQQDNLAIGDRVRVFHELHRYSSRFGVITAIDGKGEVSVVIDGRDGVHMFDPDEIERVEGGAA